MKIGKPVFKAMANNEPDYISSDCQLAGHHIEQGMEEAGLKEAQLAHPLSLLRKAYGILKDCKIAKEDKHKPHDKQTAKTKDKQRANTSLMEELEAVDWYNQRVDACADPE